jgi:hypothetical protein
MKRLISSLAVVLALAGTGAMAQSGTKEEAKKAGEATKEAGKEAGEAAKHAGKATAKAAKKSTKAVKKAVTGPDSATCADGTVQSGETEAAAAAGCAGHGGVKKQ